MAIIKNSEKIKKITMKPTAITLCKIGQDWYKHELIIEFCPDAYYPDYMEEEAWIMEHVDGKELNIEEVVDVIYGHLTEVYMPKELHIIDRIIGNKVHFNVIVEK